MLSQLNEYFTARTKQEGECLIWMGAKNPAGYGKLWVGAKCMDAHRVAWFLATGKMPLNQVLHKCDRPSCVAIVHLFEGTQRDNMHDMAQKGRKRVNIDALKGNQRGRCVKPSLRGSANQHAKLTDAAVTAIRASKGKIELQRLADQFGVSLRHAYKVRSGKRWLEKHAKERAQAYTDEGHEVSVE